MIDTHLHILPGVDDGPETIQESLTLAQMLVQEGIHSAIAIDADVVRPSVGLDEIIIAQVNVVVADIDG